MNDRIYIYPLVIRIWHFVNAIMILLLIVTGVSLQYSDLEFAIIRFDYSVTIHNIAGVILAIDYLLFFVTNIVTGNYKHYKIKFKKYPKKLWRQFYYYSAGIFKGYDPPYQVTENRKFNPLQQFSYVLVMYVFMPILVLSGFVLLFPEVVPNKIFGYGGIMIADFFHVINGFFATVFLFVHVYFCTIGKNPASSFKSIINGWHEVNHSAKS
ncbi:MAG: cytochrome b/b6 domain-containing protein [Deltaproteobacteria bacterium]